MALLIVSSTCPACKREPLATAIGNHIRAFTAHAPRPGLIGIAVDSSVAAGVAMLEKFGRFDEISVGNGWGNLVALEYVWSDSLGIAAVPQLLVLERLTEVTDSPLHIRRSNRVVAQLLGLEQISSWFAARAALTSTQSIGVKQ